MKVDYKKLSQIANDPACRRQKAKDTSDVLANYLYMMSNLCADADVWSASEMAMIINSLNRWQYKKIQLNQLNHSEVAAGDIVMVDLGLCYTPELSYGHPALVLEAWAGLIFIVPATSSPSGLEQAYHPTDNPSGRWYYRKVEVSDGFSHDCVLILNNAKIISKFSILSRVGRLTCNLSAEGQLFREIKNTLLEHLFPKEWTANKNLLLANNELLQQVDSLQKEKEEANRKIHELELKVGELQKRLDKEPNLA